MRRYIKDMMLAVQVGMLVDVIRECKCRKDDEAVMRGGTLDQSTYLG